MMVVAESYVTGEGTELRNQLKYRILRDHRTKTKYHKYFEIIQSINLISWTPAGIRNNQQDSTIVTRM